MLILVANKADMEPQISQEEITAFIQDKKLTYFQTSAKTGHNVREMFIGVATMLTEKNTQIGNPGVRAHGVVL